MKKTTFSALILLTLSLLNGLSHSTGNGYSHRFMKSYRYMADYALFDQQWFRPQLVDHNIIFNLKAQGNLLLFNANGERKSLTAISELNHAYTENGIDYAYHLTEDQFGQRWMVITYETGKVFLLGENGRGMLLKP